MRSVFSRVALICLLAGLCALIAPRESFAQTYLDNQTPYSTIMTNSNQDPTGETRRSDHLRVYFGHYNRDSGMGGMSEAMAQGNLQMFEQEWNHIVVELGMHDWNVSTNPSYIDGNKYKTNFNFLMTFNDGGGGGCYMSSDSHGFAYCMGNPASDRWDPPSGATPHEMGHVWEGTAGGFNGTDSSGSWWECTANWVMLQFINTYPQAGGYIYNSVFYPAHGRDYYDSWTIWEAAKDDPRYGTAWVNSIWTNATAAQQANEYILDRMIRLDTSGSADQAGAIKDLWGDMAKKMVTWDFERQRWLAQANTPWNGDTWEWYTRCRCPMVKMPGTAGWYRPAREHIPQEFGFHTIPLSVTPGTTVSCNFQPICDPVRQSDWRACLVAVSNNGDARYSCLWNDGTNSITLSSDESQLYLCVIATPRPMKIVTTTVNGASGNAWTEYTTDSGLQFPYAVSFTNATPTNVTYPAQSHSGMTQHPNGGGWKANTATVDATAYVGPNAQVLDNAQVKGYARIEDYAVVRNNAQVRDNAVVSGHGMVYENAQVYGNAKVRDWAMVFGYTELYGNAKAIEHAGCGGGDATNHNVVNGDVVMKGVTSVYCPSTFTGCLITDGDTANGNGAPGSTGYAVADHGVHFGWEWGDNQAVFGILADNKYQYCGLTFERQNSVFACDEFGINHGYLMNGCRNTIDSGTSTRGGYVLALNGTNQYVELHNSVNDFKDMSVAVWVKWAGTATDQRIWSMGDGVNKQMYLTPKNSSTNVVRFSISDGTTTQIIDGTAALPANTWAHVTVTFSGNTGTLYVNGAQVGQNTSMTLEPDSLNAPLMENANYLGRGNAGNYFQGSVDDFRVYNKSLASTDVSTLYATAAPGPVTPTTDTTAPYPNAATWLVAPNAVSDSAITMSATPGRDAAQSIVTAAGTSTTNIMGTVTDANGVAISGATVYISNAATSTSASTLLTATTDSSGNYTKSVANGTWHVYATATSYWPSAEVILTTNGTTIPKTNFFLEKTSLWVEYYFQCTSGGGHDSGWISMNKYTDVGLTPGTSYTYTVKMRDKAGNMTAASSALGATTQTSSAGTASFVYGPVGIANGQITMKAAKLTSPSGLVEYKFTRDGSVTSGWQASPTWTDTGLTASSSHTYTVQVRDGRGNASAISAGVAATAKDMAAPLLPVAVANWQMMPYATIDNKISMTATPVLESGAMVNYQCVSGGGPDSGWIACTTTDDNGKSYYAKWTTPNALADGTYTYHYQLKDATGNVSDYSTTYGGTIKPTTGYHACTFAQLTSLADDCLVSFGGVVTQVVAATGDPAAGNNTEGYYVVKDTASSATITVRPNTYAAVTDPSLIFKNVTVQGHLYTFSGTRYVTYASLTATGGGQTYNITGKVSDGSGNGIAGATVYFSYSPGASVNPAITTTADSSGNYTMPVLPGTWYIAAAATEYNVSADQIVTVTYTNIHNINFTLTAKPKIIGQVTDQANGGAPVAGATVCIKSSANPMVSPTYTLTTDANGMYGQLVTAGTWYVAAGKSGYETTADRSASVAAITTVNLSLKTPAPRNLPQPANILFAVVTDPLPPTGAISSWPIYSTTLPNSPTAMTITGAPTMDTASAKKWEKNSYSSSSSAKGFLVGNYTSSIPVNGASIVMAVKPTLNSTSTTTTSCVEIFGTRLSLGVRNNTGRVNFYINGTQYYAAAGTAIATGTVAIVSLVVQPGGAYNAYVNGTSVLSGTATALTSLDTTAGTNIRVARGDGTQTSYNGDLGDVYVYKSALSDTERQQLEADLTARFSGTPTSYAITASAGANGTISPVGTVPVYSGGSQTFAIAPNTGYGVASVTADGTNVGAVTSYTFSNVTATHTISAAFAPLTSYTINASAGTGGTISPSGATTVYTGTSQTFAITPTSGYRISSVVVDGVSQGVISSYTFNNVIANHAISATFVSLGRPVPRPDQLLFSVVTDSLPASGSTGAWATFCPSGRTLSTMGSPTVQTISNKKWEQNLYNDGDGFLYQRYSTTIPTTGVTVIAAVKPTRNGVGTSWTSVVDIFYDRVLLGVKNDTGLVCVRRKGSLDLSSTAIPDGQITVLSLVVQPTGEYEVFANGTQIMSSTNTMDMTVLNPDHTVDWGSDSDFTHYINIGRNNPDGWTTFNGNIGDVFVYTTALSDSDRQTLESDVLAKFTGCSITASAGSGGSISPLGTTALSYGANQTYTFTPNAGMMVSMVVVDGESVGTPASYAFTNVIANHTIAVYFSTATYTITASAGANGSISPTGTTTKNYGTSQTYTITPNAGYVPNVVVDGVSQGAIGSYTFSNITANHTISVSFSPITYTITATAGTGGSISPSGAVSVNYGTNKTFTIAPNTGYAIVDVVVDGVPQGAITSYTFNNVLANHTITVTFAKIVANIAALKAEAAGTLVKLTATETVIYAPKNSSNARTTAWFYIGEAKALGGLKVVDKTSDALSLGNQTTGLIGFVRKPSGGEANLELTVDPTGSGNTPIPPVAVGCRSVINDPNVPTNTIVTWGSVKSVNGTTSFVINDGYGDVTVMINGIQLPAGLGTKFAIVNGVVSADKTVQAQTVRAVP